MYLLKYLPSIETVNVYGVFLAVAGKGKTKVSDMEDMTQLLQLVFHCIDKVSKLRLGKEV